MSDQVTDLNARESLPVPSHDRAIMPTASSQDLLHQLDALRGS